MKMIRAIIRPETVEKVADELGLVHPALTKMHVFGRGKAGGIKVGDVVYDELPKTMLMVVVEDNEKDKVIEAIMKAGRTGKVGDGKIFVTDVEEAYTIRTGKKGVKAGEA
jgi:nitrogen regulatory protein PII 1